MKDMVGKIIAFETGMMDEDEIVVFFQELIDNGTAWTLQGSYGRLASHFLSTGKCLPRDSSYP